MKQHYTCAFVVKTNADPAMILEALEHAAWAVVEHLVDHDEPADLDEDSPCVGPACATSQARWHDMDSPSED